MPLNNKYLKYSPEITLEIFTLVYNKLILNGWKSLSLRDSYDYFKGNYQFLTNENKSYFYTSRGGNYDLEDKTQTTVQEILGYDPFIKEVIIPEYVECVKQMSAFDLGKIYKTEAYSYGEYRVLCSDGGGQIIKGHENDFKPSTKEAFEAQNQPKQAVHCTSQEEWDFVSEKMSSPLRWDSKYPCRILSSLRWAGSIEFCKKENIQILSFQEWKDLNGYKMENKLNQEFKVGDYVKVIKFINGDSLGKEYYKIKEIFQIHTIIGKSIAGGIWIQKSPEEEICSLSCIHATPGEINNHLISIGQIPVLETIDRVQQQIKRIQLNALNCMGIPVGIMSDKSTNDLFNYRLPTEPPSYIYEMGLEHSVSKLNLILSIDNEELPMVNIIKTKTVNLLNNN